MAASSSPEGPLKRRPGSRSSTASCWMLCRQASTSSILGSSPRAMASAAVSARRCRYTGMSFGVEGCGQEDVLHVVRHAHGGRGRHSRQVRQLAGGAYVSDTISRSLGTAGAGGRPNHCFRHVCCCQCTDCHPLILRGHIQVASASNRNTLLSLGFLSNLEHPKLWCHHAAP